MTFKKLIQKIHLWLGFIAGLVLVVNLVPASIFAFNTELKEWWYHKALFTERTGVQKLPLSVLKDKVQGILGQQNGAITYISISNDPYKAYAFGVFKDNKAPGYTYFSESEIDKEVYIDPYTGKINGEIDLRHDWIKICEAIHRRMLLHYNYGGHWIIAYVTLIIIFSLLTGLVLWFPRSKAALKQRFVFKRKVRWRRRNYDVHNVGGFYSHLLILFLAVTGLLWSFDWWANGFYRLLGEEHKKIAPAYQIFTSAPLLSSTIKPLDRAFEDAQGKRTTWMSITIGLPEAGDKENLEKLFFYLKFNNHSGWDESDQYTYSSGQLTKQLLHEQKTTGIKWDDSNYAFHTGSIYGLPTKILMSMTTLFCASLPITGFVIWYGKRKGSKKK